MISSVATFTACSCIIVAAGFIWEIVLERYIVTENKHDPSPPPPQSIAGVNSSGIL